MPKLKKQYFRNKFNSLSTYPYCISIDASNLTSTEINQIAAKINTIDCYFSLSYTKPPKVTGGGLLIRVFPKTIKDIELNLKELLTKKIFLGLYIKKHWYNVLLIKNSKKENNKYKILSLLIKKSHNVWLTQI